jgi:transposase
MDKSITYVGLDVHKGTIAIALAESGKRGEVREYGTIPNTPAAVKAVAAKLVGSSGCGCFPSPALIVGDGLAHQLEKSLAAPTVSVTLHQTRVFVVCHAVSL